jgi:hypothetical protein
MHTIVSGASSAVSQKIHCHAPLSLNQPSIEAAMLSESSMLSE